MGKKRRWAIGCLGTIVIFVGVAIAGLYGLSRYATPYEREKIDAPLYTIGDPTYASALEQGLNVVKFGPLPLGIYAGGYAFADRDAAASHLKSMEDATDGWGVYRLSGDFEKDTYEHKGQRHIVRSLLVLERVDATDAASAE